MKKFYFRLAPIRSRMPNAPSLFFFSLKKPRIQKNNIKHKSGQHEAQARPAGPWTKFENPRLGTACHYPKPGPCPAKVCEAIHPLSIRITRERAHFKLDLLNKNHYWTKSCKRIKKINTCPPVIIENSLTPSQGGKPISIIAMRLQNFSTKQKHASHKLPPTIKPDT